MSAHMLLSNLAQRGITLEAHGTDLIVEGPTRELTDDLVVTLKALKADLLAALEPDAGWGPEDWRAYFDERAGIREHDGKLPREEAECLAFEDTISQWLCRHPPIATAPEQGCVHCRACDREANPLLPVLASGGHTWVHDRCHAEWLAQRRGQARRELHRVVGPSPTLAADIQGQARRRYTSLR